MIAPVLAEIDGRVEAILTLNSSLTATYAQIADNMASQLRATESDQYIESRDVLQSFVRNVMLHASADDELPKPSLVDTGPFISNFIYLFN